MFAGVLFTSLAAGKDVSASIGGEIVGAATHGNYIYAAQRDTIHVLDASDRKHIRIVGSFTDKNARIERIILRWPAIFYVKHEYGSYYSGLGCVDVTSASAPRQLELIESYNAKNFDVTTSGPMLLILSRFVHEFDISNPLKPKRIKSLDLEETDFERVKKAYAPEPPVSLTHEALYSGRVHNVKVIGKIAYVLDDEPGLKTIDISDPAHPIYLGLAKDSETIKRQLEPKKPIPQSGVAWRGYRICIVTNGEQHSLIIEKPSNATSETIATLKEWTGYGGGCDNLDECWTSGDWLFVFGDERDTGGHHNYLEIYNLKNPQKPVEYKALQGFDGSPEQVEINGNLAFIAEGKNGLSIRSIVP